MTRLRILILGSAALTLLVSGAVEARQLENHNARQLGEQQNQVAKPRIRVQAGTTPANPAEARARIGNEPARDGAPADEHWRVGQGQPTYNFLFLHGLGGEPRNGLDDRISRELGSRGICFDVKSPWLRPVRRGLLGRMEDDGLHTMTYQLQKAGEILENSPGPMVLVGHSFGGKLANLLAKKYPDKVACVVGLAPAVNMLYSYYKQLTGQRGLPAKAELLAQLDGYKGQMEADLARAQGAHGGDARGTRRLKSELSYLAIMRDLAAQPIGETEMETGIRKPTLVLHGTEDGAVSIHYARRFAEANPQAVRLVEIEGVDHGFAKRMGGDDFLPQIDRRATERATRQMVDEIVNFLGRNVRPGNAPRAGN